MSFLFYFLFISVFNPLWSLPLVFLVFCLHWWFSKLSAFSDLNGDLFSFSDSQIRLSLSHATGHPWWFSILLRHQASSVALATLSVSWVLVLGGSLLILLRRQPSISAVLSFYSLWLSHLYLVAVILSLFGPRFIFLSYSKINQVTYLYGCCICWFVVVYIF